MQCENTQDEHNHRKYFAFKRCYTLWRRWSWWHSRWQSVISSRHIRVDGSWSLTNGNHWTVLNGKPGKVEWSLVGGRQRRASMVRTWDRRILIYPWWRVVIAGNCVRTINTWGTTNQEWHSLLRSNGDGSTNIRMRYKLSHRSWRWSNSKWLVSHTWRCHQNRSQTNWILRQWYRSHHWLSVHRLRLVGREDNRWPHRRTYHMGWWTWNSSRRRPHEKPLTIWKNCDARWSSAAIWRLIVISHLNKQVNKNVNQKATSLMSCI